MPVTNLLYKFYSRFFFIVIFSLLFYNANAQLTYANLSVQYDSPWVCSNLQLIPIKFKDTATAKNSMHQKDIITFKEAMREGKATVKEMSTLGGSDVGMLTVKNHSKKNILVESGDIVSGGMQDRAFAETTIIPPGDDENFLPVFCVEKGRWKNKAGSFRYAGAADADVKKIMNTSKKQNKIWQEIDRQLAAGNKQNATHAYLNLYRDTTVFDTVCLNFFRRKMMESDSLYTGFVAVSGDHIINCEIFGNSDLCRASFDDLIRSYLRSVHNKQGTPDVSNETIKAFLDKFLKTEAQQQKYLNGHGNIYIHGKEVIHLIAYPD